MIKFCSPVAQSKRGLRTFWSSLVCSTAIFHFLLFLANRQYIQVLVTILSLNVIASNLKMIYAVNASFLLSELLKIRRSGKIIRFYYKCEGRIEKFVLRIAVWHHEACGVMTNGDPEFRFFYPILTRIMDSFSCSPLFFYFKIRF